MITNKIKTARKLDFLLKICLLLCWGCSPLHAGDFLKDGDFHFWMFNGLQKKLSEKTTLFFDSELRYGDQASEVYVTYVQTGLIFSICKVLDITPAYRQLYARNVFTNHWITQHAPFFEFVAKFELKKWKIQDRNRIVYSHIDGLPDFWDYRNRLKIEPPWTIGKIGVKPWIANEIFILERRGFSQNRLAIGGTIPLTKTMSSSLFYMLRQVKFVLLDEWKSFNTMGLYFNYKY